MHRKVADGNKNKSWTEPNEKRRIVMKTMFTVTPKIEMKHWTNLEISFVCLPWLCLLLALARWLQSFFPLDAIIKFRITQIRFYFFSSVFRNIFSAISATPQPWECRPIWINMCMLLFNVQATFLETPAREMPIYHF